MTTTTRRLAAILAADVAGYSRLMAADEVGTLAALKAARREIVDPAIAEHRGRIVKTTGDGMLVEFASAVDAVTCAMTVQEAMGGRGGNLSFRIGINVGDIIIDGDDIFGDGVNVAARVENECEPGRVYLSDDAFRQLRAKTSFTFADLGEKSLKNLDRPIRIYVVKTSGSTFAHATVTTLEAGEPLPLPDKPSIAVLPFQNMSGDPEQEYFADGMVEDIITALSRFKSLFVIARNSSFTYKGKAVDIKQVGRELGVRYVLEGSVRKSGARVRITGQLIEAATGTHIWADRFDGAIEDAFELQDKITTSVVGAIVPRFDEAEIGMLKRKPPDSWTAYDHYLRAKALLNRNDVAAIADAERELRKVVALDPDFAPAFAWAAFAKQLRRRQQITLTDAEVAEAIRMAERAVELAGDDGEVLALASAAFANVANELERGRALADRATSVNPNASMAWLMKGWTCAYHNQLEQASEAFDQTIRLNPFDRRMVWYAIWGKSWVCRLLGRPDQAVVWAEQLTAQEPNNFTALMALEAAYFESGRVAEARSVVERMNAAHPNLRGSWIRQTYLRTANPRDLAIIDKAIARYGYPE